MKRLHEYSQHFLRSPHFVLELIGHSDIKRTDTVYDLGAGSGVVSAALSKRAARVVAVEFEPQTITKLRENMKKYENVDVVERDIMQAEFPLTPFKIFANIPFHLSSPLLRRLTNLPVPPQSMYLIVQRQFARKLLPSHKGFSNQLGMMIGPWFRIRIRKPLKRTDFWPHPNVDTVLIEVKKRPEPLVDIKNRSQYERFIAKGFTDAGFYARLHAPAVKPSSLVLEEWVRLFAAYTRKSHQSDS